MLKYVSYLLHLLTFEIFVLLLVVFFPDCLLVINKVFQFG